MSSTSSASCSLPLSHVFPGPECGSDSCFFVPRVRVPPRSPTRSPPAVLSLLLEPIVQVSASDPSVPRGLDPSRYDFSVGKVDLGDKGSALVRQVSSSGFKFKEPLVCPASPRGRKPPVYKPPPGQQREYDLLIAGLKSARIISRCSARPPFVCNHFTVGKHDGSLRFIFDGKTVNLVAPPPPKFRLDGVRVCKGRARHFSWAAKLDIRHCFYHVPLHPSIRKFFSMRLKDGYWSFNCLPMGFSWSPYIVARMLRETLSSVASIVTFYADDIVVWGNSEGECWDNLHRVIQLLEEAGWVLAESKQEDPSQCLDILGVSFDLVSKSCRLSSKFRRALSICILDLSRLHRASKRTLASVFGSVQWGSVAVSSLAPLANPLLSAMHSGSTWDSLVDVSSSVLSCLEDLAQVVVCNPWCSFRGLRPGHLRFSSDASSRLVAHVSASGSTFCRLLSSEELLLHIGKKEAIALLASLEAAWRQRKDGLFLVDAKALFFALQKGRSNNSLFSACCLLVARAREAGLAWRIQWVPSAENVADLPTRPELLPRSVSHPEFLTSGVRALIPSGWSSPRLASWLSSGV